MKEAQVSSFDELVEAASGVIEKVGFHTWFRGIARADWKLVPSVFRLDRPREYEWYLCGNFVLQAPLRYEKCPDRQDKGQWLTLMRHYGLPLVSLIGRNQYSLRRTLQ